MKDYYKLLSVERRASTDEIKLAYRRFAQKWHPDVCSDPGAEEIFKAGKQAYEFLSDPATRSAIDTLLAQEAQPRSNLPDQRDVDRRSIDRMVMTQQGWQVPDKR